VTPDERLTRLREVREFALNEGRSHSRDCACARHEDARAFWVTLDPDDGLAFAVGVLRDALESNEPGPWVDEPYRTVTVNTEALRIILRSYQA
jgi:hypothetical protein